MADRLFRDWIRQQGVVDQHTGEGDACERPRAIDNKLKAASGVILGLAIGALFWTIVIIVFWR